MNSYVAGAARSSLSGRAHSSFSQGPLECLCQLLKRAETTQSAKKIHARGDYQTAKRDEIQVETGAQ